MTRLLVATLVGTLRLRRLRVAGVTLSSPFPGVSIALGVLPVMQTSLILPKARSAPMRFEPQLSTRLEPLRLVATRTRVLSLSK